MSQTIQSDMTTYSLLPFSSSSPSISDRSTETPVSFTKMALDCPDILYAIGEWIPVFENETVYNKRIYMTYKPQTLFRCCLVSKQWNKILTPLLWRVDDTGSMRKVPQVALEMHSDHVRVYEGLNDKWFTKTYLEPPMHTQLRQLIMGEAVKTGDVAMRMISMNSRLRMITLFKSPLLQQFREGAAELTHLEKDDFKENTHSPTNPLGHLRSTLEHLTLRQMYIQGLELYYLLRTVSKWNLKTLELDNIWGTFDIQDIVFECLTRLCLWLDNSIQPGLHELIGYAPHLEHLELSGLVDDRRPFSFEPLVHIMRGTRQEETPREKEDRLKAGKPELRQWSRPQLKILRIQGLHSCKSQEDASGLGNDVMFLELIRASGRSISMTKEMARPSSLRELDIPLWFVDDLARGAIEASSLTLEVLKIKIQRGRDNLPTWKHERQGRILRKILQSCSRLRVMEVWDQNGDEDISVIMTGLIGDYGGLYHDGGYDGSGTESENGDKVRTTEALVCPDLVSLTLKSIRTNHELQQTEVEEERRYFENVGDHGDTSPWVMPKLQWDLTLLDGTDYLMDSHWRSFEIYEEIIEGIGQEEEGDQLLRRFLRCISPSRKLKELQLGQLRFTRQV